MEIMVSTLMDQMELENNFKREVNLINNYLNYKLDIDYSILIDLRNTHSFYYPLEDASGYISDKDFESFKKLICGYKMTVNVPSIRPILVIPYNIILRGTLNRISLSREEAIKEYRRYYILNILSKILSKDIFSKVLKHLNTLLENDLISFYESSDGPFRKKISKGIFCDDLDSNITSHTKKISQKNKDGVRVQIDSRTGKLQKVRSSKENNKEPKKKESKKRVVNDVFTDLDIEEIIKMSKQNK